MSEPQLTDTGLLSDGSHQLDINGRPITPRRRRWGMNINILCAGLGTFFAVTFWPGSALFSMFMSERLDATQSQIGFFSAMLGLGQIFQVLGVFIFDRTKTRKVLWVTMVLLYRISCLVAVGFALWFYYHGSSPTLIWAMLAFMALTFAMAQMTANAWWSWLADLAPESSRGRFLGNRQLAANLATLVAMLPVVLLDIYGKDAAGHYTAAADPIFIGIFFLCVLSGIVDIIIHAYIPEPARLDRPDSITLGDTVRNLIQPMRDANFRRFTLAMTLGSFAVMFWAPFVWPYLKDQATIDINYSMLFISTAVSSLAMLAGSRYWGILIDRFGSKPILTITYTAGLLCVYLLFITPGNAVLLVTIVSILGGLLWSGMGLAQAQLMLTMSPHKIRNSYVATHAAITGLTIFAAPMLAGLLGQYVRDYFEGLPYYYQLPWGTIVTHMQVLALIGLLWRLAVLPLFLRIKEGHEKPMGTVLATVLGTGQFRTLYAMRIIAGRDRGKKLSTLRRMDAESDQLAIEDVVDQLDDAEPEIRREAILALGRIRGPEAVSNLVSQLSARDNDARIEAMRALSLAGSPEAAGPLLEMLRHPSVVIRQRAAEALGELRSPEAAQPLMALLKSDPSPNVFGQSAIALARLGVVDAVWEIVPRMHLTHNRALRRQLATAVGDLLNQEDHFYALLNEEVTRPGRRLRLLVRRTRWQLWRYLKRPHAPAETETALKLQVTVRHMEQAHRDYCHGRHAEAVRQLYAVGREMLANIYGFTGDDEVLIENALSRRMEHGTGMWLLSFANRYAESKEADASLLQLDALLMMHLLSAFVTDWTQVRPPTGLLGRYFAEPLPDEDKKRVLSRMRRMERSHYHHRHSYVMNLLIEHLDNADPEIRREAALALGRVGGAQAVEALVRQLTNPESDVKPEAAQALGITGDLRAVRPLVEKLKDPDEIVRQAAAEALGHLPSPDAAQALMQLIRTEQSDNIFGRVALALSRIGVLDTVWEVLPRMHRTGSVALRRQLASAVGRLVGEPGAFYRLMTEELREPCNEVVKLATDTSRNLRQRSRTMASGRQGPGAAQLELAARGIGLALERYEYQKFDQALDELHGAVLETLKAIYGFDGGEDLAVEFALSRNGQLGVAVWLLQTGRQHAAASRAANDPTAARGPTDPAGRNDLLRLDTLLGFHFLNAFAETLNR